MKILLGVLAVLALLGALAAFLKSRLGPGLRVRFESAVEEGTRGVAGEPPLLREDDLQTLPAAVQRYLRFTGAVGRPRVLNLRARFRGEIKNRPDAPWSAFTAEQANFFDRPARLFLIDASLHGLPFQALHRYLGPSATMEVRAAGLFQVVDARGPQMDQSETVTMLNDLCVLAPSALVGAPVQWEEIDARTVRVHFSNAGHRVSATLAFDPSGALADFWSDDRFQSADGKTFRRLRWSTPLRDWRRFDERLLPATGEAVWSGPEGVAPYGRFRLDAIAFNLGAR